MGNDDRDHEAPPPAMVSWPVPGKSAEPAPSDQAAAMEEQAPPIVEPPAFPTDGLTSAPSSPSRLSILVAVLATAAVVGVAAWFIWPESPAPVSAPVAAQSTNGTAPTAQAPAATTPADNPPTASKPTPSRTSAAADTSSAKTLAELSGLRSDGLAQVTLDGSWAAQLSSKSVGITDPLAVAANGTHRFFASDILKEHLQIRADDRFSGASVVLLKGTDFGQRSTYRGKTLWVTLASGFFYDEESVKDFCSTAYPDKSGDALANVCLPRRLTPLH